MAEKVIVGLIEEVSIRGGNGAEKAIAKIDTGATSSSIDAELAAKLHLGPVEEVKTIRSANGIKTRPAVRATVTICGKEFDNLFSIADRSHMNYPILIGQDILKQGFMIDPTKED